MSVPESWAQRGVRYCIPLIACGLVATLTGLLQEQASVATNLMLVAIMATYVAISILRAIVLIARDRVRQLLGIAEDPTSLLSEDAGATSATL